MSEDAGFALGALPDFTAPPSLLVAAPEHVAAYDIDHRDRPDPLDGGFFLVGGVLAPLPPRIRLPHEDDAGEEVLV